MMSLMAVSAFGMAVADSQEIFHPLDSHRSSVYTDDLPGLMAKKHIRVLVTFNRTNFFLAAGKARGFEYALFRKYEKFLNQGIGRGQLQVTLEFVPVARDRLIPALTRGYGDIAGAGLTITGSRRKQVAFSAPYLTGIDELLVTHKNVKKPRSLEDLSGRRVYVRKSSSYFESLVALNQRLKKLKKPPVVIIEADEYLETEDILEMVNSGAIERTVCDSHLAEIWAGVLHDIRVHPKIRLRSEGKIAWMVRKDNPKLKASLDRFIKKHRKGTLLGNIFFDQYYKENEWLKNPLQGDPREKLATYKKTIQKYAARYGFDWRLIAALAYQESNLNHHKKSRRGAVGLLQVRPETAADPKINIKNVHLVENNIHAGVKYLAFLRDRYYSDPKIRPRDQVRFSLAAYNAGPAKIRRVRSLATEMNLDPNQWFRNSEMAALRVLGQETVRYVSNINKYYILYVNALEQRKAREEIKKKI